MYANSAEATSTVNNPLMLTRPNSLRLKGFDYTLPEAYFITICCFQRRSLLGTIVGGLMLPSALGEYVSEVWLAQPSYQPALVIDTWVVMPNHFHAVIGLANSNNSTNPLTLGKSVQGFKAFST